MINWTIYLNIIGYGLILFSACIFSYIFYRKFVKQRIEKEQLKKKLIELEELNYTKQVFLTAMSHQLRTPLSGAKWAMEVLLKDKLCSRPELLEESRDRINNAIEIINKILQTAELEIKKEDISVKQEDVDLKLLVDRIISDQNYLIKAKGIKLEYGKYEPAIIKGDEKLLRLSLTNILDNAFRYSPKGIVKLNLFNSNAEAVLTVEDNGVGIDPKDLEFITFQKFYRGKNAMMLDPNESGVGLYVTRKIIEIHNGRIAISSALGKGTKVSVALPIVSA